MRLSSMPDREKIFGVLFDLVKEVQWGEDPLRLRSFKTMSRRVKLFSDVPKASQPACYQSEHNEQSAQSTGLPYRRIWEAQWIIYHAVGSDKAIPAIENNLILGAVERVLAPKPSDPGFFEDRNTLGGLVHHCHIDGTLFKDPGDIDNQGMLVVPIKLLVP